MRGALRARGSWKGVEAEEVTSFRSESGLESVFNATLPEEGEGAWSARIESGLEACNQNWRQVKTDVRGERRWRYSYDSSTIDVAARAGRGGNLNLLLVVRSPQSSEERFGEVLKEWR